MLANAARAARQIGASTIRAEAGWLPAASRRQAASQVFAFARSEWTVHRFSVAIS
jgi:hypothetical protein